MAISDWLTYGLKPLSLFNPITAPFSLPKPSISPGIDTSGISQGIQDFTDKIESTFKTLSVSAIVIAVVVAYAMYKGKI